MITYPIFRTRNELPNVFWRPQLQLRSLSIEIRWEATRLHPAYFTSWKLRDANDIFNAAQVSPAQIATQEAMEKSRMLCLNAIGVPPEAAVDPATEFSELGELNASWMSGAVHPTSMRGLATVLASLLPQDTLVALGEAFAKAGCQDELSEELDGPLPNRIQAMNLIGSMDKEGLDCLTPEPFVSINPAATVRQLRRDANELLKQWKKELGLPQVRERTDKHKSYLEVWDLREGWTAGSYLSGPGRRFRDIASELKRPLTTVHSQYKKAFELITGHQFCSESFIELFGWRFSRLFSDGAYSRHRQVLEATTVDPSESRLGTDLNSESDGSSSLAASEYFLSDFMDDYKSLKALGKTNKEVAAELGVEDYDAFLQLIERFEIT